MGSALLFGCGGGSGNSSGAGSGGVTASGSSGAAGAKLEPADWSAAVPATLPTSSLTDVNLSSAGSSGAGAVALRDPVAEAVATDCHPALFTRTYEIADILNNHTHVMMDRIAGIIAHPKARDNSPNCTVDNPSAPTKVSCTIDPAAGLFEGYPLTLTWEKSSTSSQTQYVTNVYIQSSQTPAANLHQCELGVSPAPSSGACSQGTCPTCTTIFSATLNVTPAANGFEVSSPAGTPVSFDFTSLNQVDPTEKATGTFQVNVDFTKDTTKPNPYRRVVGLTFSNFIPALTQSEITAGEANHGARSGSLAHIAYTGSNGGGGGAMEFVDEVILYCPASGQTTPPSLYSDALTVGRWYLNGGTLFSRVDAEAVGDSGGTTPTGSGGGNNQLPSGTSYIGAVCHSNTLETAFADGVSDPWMFAETNASGGVVANSYQCGPMSGGSCATSCGTAFGSLPSVTASTLSNPYSFNGLVPSIASSGIPTDPATIETALAPLLCGTGIGTAWTGQPNCP